MSLKTASDYVDSLNKLHRTVYVLGKSVDYPNDHPIVKPSTNAVAETYRLALEPEGQELLIAESTITGKPINRFCALHRSADDLVKKVKMLRLLGQKTASCFQRCVGMDAINAVETTTFEMDKPLGTNYHKRFIDYLAYVQENDLVVDGTMTDVKGDRSLRPSEQADKDMYLRICDRDEKGIWVVGAKTHQTGALNSHEFLIMPTVAMSEKDKDYAVCFAVPADTKGITQVLGRQSCDTRKMEEGTIDSGNFKYGGHETVVMFDNVFIPWERVFMDGEYQFSGMLVERFASYHRQSYGGCKVGVGDVLIGAAALAAEHNGVLKASHIQDKLVEMIHLNETLYANGIACSSEGTAMQSGTYLVDVMLANVCKQNVTRFPYEIARLAEDLAGGNVVTLPSEQDFRNGKVGELLKKYYMGKADVKIGCRIRNLRLIEDICLGTGAVGYRTESLHGAGSPQAQRIMMRRLGNIPGKMALAKALTCPGECPCL